MRLYRDSKTFYNFQTFPVNMFPDPNLDGPDSIHWLYNTMSILYSDWLPGWQQQQTIKDGGYYSVKEITTS